MERKNIVLFIILALLIVAIAVVGVLILRKRTKEFAPRATSTVIQPVKLPPGTKPLESYVPERPWQEGDPPIPTSDIYGGAPTTGTQP